MLKVVLAVVDVLGFKPLTLKKNNTPNHWTMWTLHAVEILKVEG